MFVVTRGGGYTGMVGRGRTIVGAVALVFLFGFASACSSDSSKSSAPKGSTAAHARAVAQAKKARRRRVVAHRRALARRRARAVAARRQLRARRANAVKLEALRRSPDRDLAAIQRSVNRLNVAFQRSVRRGIARAAALNYWAAAGVYTRQQCRTFAADRGAGAVSEMLVVQPSTLTPTPGWVDPAVGRAPGGRVYAVAVDEIQTFVPTGEQRVFPQQLRVSVGPDGHARLFFRCA
jgi:hypothetical protein